MRKFAVAYARLANATRAAIEAGYSPKAAGQQGCLLLKNPNIIALIEANRVRRDVHADQTYQQLIALANAGMKLANDALNDPASDRREKVFVLEGARRAVETVARCEGLMVEVPSRPDEGRLTLQNLAQKLRKGIELVKAPTQVLPAPPKVEVLEIDLQPIASPQQPIGVNLDAPAALPTSNGNSNGHHSEAGAA